jgi:DNA-binding MarR family transcriptional regulator
VSIIVKINYNLPVTSRRHDASRAWQLLTQLLFAHRSRLPSVAAGLELSPVQLQVLHVLAPDRPLAMGELARTLACDRSNVTGLIDRLESRRLVERRPSPRDRRVKVLVLTPTGARVRAELQARLADPPETFSRLSPAEQRALLKILQRLIG